MRQTIHCKKILILMLLLTAQGCDPSKNGDIRILVAGIKHESNSFMPYLTEAEDFNQERGDAITGDRTWAGFLAGEGVEVLPTLVAACGPSGLVSK